MNEAGSERCTLMTSTHEGTRVYPIQNMFRKTISSKVCDNFCRSHILRGHYGGKYALHLVEPCLQGLYVSFRWAPSEGRTYEAVLTHMLSLSPQTYLRRRSLHCLFR